MERELNPCQLCRETNKRKVDTKYWHIVVVLLLRTVYDSLNGVATVSNMEEKTMSPVVVLMRQR